MSQDGSAFSAYLIGTYERRGSVFTSFQIINPTEEWLEIVVQFYDDQEELHLEKTYKLSPIDLEEIIFLPDPEEFKPLFGVVRIISYRPGEQEPFPGIVGYQRQVLVEDERIKCFSESALASVPTELAGKRR